jgi:hypothetical protein
MYFVAWLACADPAPDDGATHTADPTGTDTSEPTVSSQSSCVLSDNPQVVSCTTSLPEAGPATLVLSASGLPTRTFASSEAQLEHQIWGWGLRADTTYDWSLAGQQGTLTTGPLPEELATTSTIEVTGSLFGIDAVFVYLACGYFAIIDGDGEILWAMPTIVYDALPDGMLWSPETLSVLAISDSTMSLDQSVFVETHLSGTELRRLFPGTFDLNLTHDIGQWGPYTYLLGEDDGIGGFEVFEGDKLVGSVSLMDFYPEVNGLEIAHVNGLVLTEDGEAVMSLHAYDSVLGIDGDPLSPTFGELRWMAAGAPGGGQDLPDPTYLPKGPVGFKRQHNASRHGDSLWVFDNMSQDQSRALHLGLDAGAGWMSERESWLMGRVCSAQGGAIPIEGGVLATCAPTAEVKAFREGQKEPDWSLYATCGPLPPVGLIPSSTRAFPVRIR